MEQSTATKPGSPPKSKPDATCPHCGGPAEKDQLVCLRCGGRIALDYRRPPGWKLPAAIVAAVALIAAVAFGWALREVTDNAKSEVASAPAGKPVAAPAPAKSAKPKAREAAPPQSPGAAAKQPGTWPAGRSAFTVILVSSNDPRAASKLARGARRTGVPAGYLRSNDYPSLQKGFWYVYAGVYRDRGQAERAAAKFGPGYSGAYVQYVRSADSGKSKPR